MATVGRSTDSNGTDKSRSKRRRDRDEESDDDYERERSRHSKSSRRDRERSRSPRSPSRKSPSRRSSPPPPLSSSAGEKPEKMLTVDEIKKLIEDRKRQVMKTMPQMPQAPPVQDEKYRRQLELQAKISAMMAGKPEVFGGALRKSGLFAASYIRPPVMPGTLSMMTPGMGKPGPVILDTEGRTIDAVTGKEISFEQRGPTLKANIRAKKREDFRVVQEKVADEIREEQHPPDFYDARVHVKPPVRSRRTALQFHDPGVYVKQGQMLRATAQLAKLQDSIAQAAKKTGITSAAALARIAPKKTDSVDSGMIPDIEWWDGSFLQLQEMLLPDRSDLEERVQKVVTNLIEHPVQLAAPIDKDKPVALPMMLTKKEKKKLRRQNRREKLKDEQEKQRIGLQPPPEPKVKMANLMRVLGNEAIQDPTKVEANVRAQIAKRRKVHESANALRKLTETEKRQKKIKKMKEDTTEEVLVAIFRVKELSDPSRKFKVETNATQLYMTGVVVLNKETTVVVVEGGPKQQKKFKRLMLNRIKWSNDESAAGGKAPCELVWEGSTKKRHFGPLKFKACISDMAARELLRKHGVEEYWDLAYGAAILESAG